MAAERSKLAKPLQNLDAILEETLMRKIWFTSDTHFGHAGIIKHCLRPFEGVEEMDAEIIERWNHTVAPNDDVWHLGDVSFRKDPGHYLAQLNGHIHIVLGNHDEPSKLAKTRAAWVGEVKYLRADGQRLFLSHYAHRVWKNSVHGSYHLFGHSHGDLPGIGRSMDVGVDAHHFFPISLDQVVAVLEKEGPTNHHVERSMV